MPEIKISDTGRKLIRDFIIEYKDHITLSKLRSIAAKRGILISDSTGFKRPAINETFDQLEEKQILPYIKDYYQEGLYSKLRQYKSVSEPHRIKKYIESQEKEIKEFLDKINSVKNLTESKIKLNYDGEFERYEGEIIRYEEKILQDILLRNNLDDMKTLLNEAEKVIAERKEDASDCASKSGKVLEGVLKYIFYKITKDASTPGAVPLDKAIQFYLDKISSKEIKFIDRNESIYQFISDIKKEFRNITSHYSVDDEDSFTFKKIPLEEGILCLWITKAIIVFLLNRYEERR